MALKRQEICGLEKLETTKKRSQRPFRNFASFHLFTFHVCADQRYQSCIAPPSSPIKMSVFRLHIYIIKLVRHLRIWFDSESHIVNEQCVVKSAG